MAEVGRGCFSMEVLKNVYQSAMNQLSQNVSNIGRLITYSPIKILINIAGNQHEHTRIRGQCKYKAMCSVQNHPFTLKQTVCQLNVCPCVSTDGVATSRTSSATYFFKYGRSRWAPAAPTADPQAGQRSSGRVF